MLSETENEANIGANFVACLSKKLGSGAFGDIYLGKNKKTNEEVAVKIESSSIKTPQLIYESKILKLLQGGGNIINKHNIFLVGIPNVYHSTTISESNIMVVELLGSNLDDYMVKTQEKKFSLKTVLMIADQIVHLE
jgi:serine/threonine protein kinase